MRGTWARVTVGRDGYSFNMVKYFHPIRVAEEVPREAEWSSSGELHQRIFWAYGSNNDDLTSTSEIRR